MRRIAFRATVSILLVLGGKVASVAHAALMLSLASSANLQALPVGQKVSFQVQLAGLANGQELDSLYATVHYTDALLGPPTVAKGAILPQPLSDPADFVSAEDAGLADASFLTFSPDSAHHIQTDGVFFSFETEVMALGAGQLWFNFADASQFNPDAPENPIFITPAKGPALDFRAVVPEPAAWVLLAVAGLAAVPYFLKRRRSRSAAFTRPSRPQ